MPQLHLPLEKLPAKVNRLYIAFSSGIDSCVLLHRLIQQQHSCTLILWHINHGLQPNAHQMQQLAEDLAAKYDLDIRVDQLDLNPDEGNLEASARQARYEIFSAALTEQDALLTAHHMNDQAETLMLNLMRGSGAAGLRAIADVTRLGQGYLFRPLLDFQREVIEQYAHRHRLRWVEDASNQSIQYDRNYLRHKILPRIKQRWPAAIQQLHRVSEWQKEQQQLLEDLAAIDLSQCSREHTFSQAACLDLGSLANLTQERQKNLIRYWINSNHKQQMGFKALYQVLQQLSAAADAMPIIQAQGYSLRCYDGLLFIVEDFQQANILPSYEVSADQALEIKSLDLRISRQEVINYLGLAESGQRLSLRFRTQHSSADLSNRHRLKRLFQKHRVPPWMRDRVAQIYVQDELTELLLL